MQCEITRIKTSEEYKELFITKAKTIHTNPDGTPKFDYSLVDYKTAKLKVKIICPKHGIFEQKPNGHLNGKGCSECQKDNYGAHRRKSVEQFIEESKQRFGNKFDYSKVVYINADTPVTLICPEHGEYQQKPEKHLQSTYGCATCGKESYKNREVIVDTERFFKIFKDKANLKFIDQKNTGKFF